MLETHIYLCGVVTEPYTAFYEIAAHSPDQAADEYCHMYEGGWSGDHFNLTEGEPRTIQVQRKGEASLRRLTTPEIHLFEVGLAEDDDNEYVISEVK